MLVPSRLGAAERFTGAVSRAEYAHAGKQIPCGACLSRQQRAYCGLNTLESFPARKVTLS